MYTAYVLSEQSRKQLAEVFPPKFSDHIGHHITIAFGVPKGTETPKQPTDVKVIGYVCDDEGLETLLVSVDGSAARPDGKTFHITWSLERDKFKPKDSNELIEHGILQLGPIVPITVTPAVLK